MKAIALHEYGSTSLLTYEDVEDPKPAAGEVLVCVSATSINPADWLVRAGAVKDIIPITFPAHGFEVSYVAQATGFFDQSHLAQQFQRSFFVKSASYRKTARFSLPVSLAVSYSRHEAFRPRNGAATPRTS
jgi:AraC-like DNA-binding protein